MEAAQTLARQPELTINEEPLARPKGVVYLDPADPLDSALIDYRQAIQDDAIPTAAEQRRLIAGIRGGELSDARELVASHAGMIAAVAYPFRRRGLQDSEDLLKEGAHALIRAAKAYDRAAGVDFNDFAAAAIHDSLSRAAPEPGSGSFLARRERPMEGVYAFMETVRPADTPGKIRKMREQSLVASTEMTPTEAKILHRALYMTDREIAASPGVGKSKDGVGYIIRNFARRNGLSDKNRTSLVLELHELGMDFDVVKPEQPLDEMLYAHEMDIARLVHLPNKAIIEKLGLDWRLERVSEVIYEAKNKVGARSTQELALMARMFDNGQEALRIDRRDNRWRLAKQLGVKTLEACNMEDLMSVMTDTQRNAVSVYYLAETAVTWRDAATEEGVHPTTLQRAAHAGILSMVDGLES